MKKKYLLILTIFSLQLNVNASDTIINKQKSEIKIQDNIHRVYIDLLGAEYSYEKRLFDYISLYSTVGITTWDGEEFGIYAPTLFPAISTEARFYFNYKSRYKAKDNVYKNSAFFVALGLNYIVPIELYKGNGGLIWTPENKIRDFLWTNLSRFKYWCTMVLVANF